MKYKSFEELKDELDDKIANYLYETGLDLLKKIDKATEDIAIIIRDIEENNYPPQIDDLYLIMRDLRGDTNE